MSEKLRLWLIIFHYFNLFLLDSIFGMSSLNSVNERSARVYCDNTKTRDEKNLLK